MPEAFDGSAERCTTFLNQVQLYLKIQNAVYTTDPERIEFIGTLLTGTAAEWFFGHGLQDERFKQYATFKQFFMETFDEHDRERVAAKKITRIRQGTRDVKTYASEFLALKRKVHWNEDTMIHLFREGLNTEIKSHLLHFPKHDTLQKLMTDAMSIDAHIREEREEITVTSTPSFNRNLSRTPIVSQEPPTEAMDIDSVQRTRRQLSPQERERRLREGRCFRCGTQGHIAAQCPTRSQAGKDLGH